MPRYQFKARDEQARVTTGLIDGNSVDEIIDKLAEKHLVPVAIDELNFDDTRKDQGYFDRINRLLMRFQKHVSYKDVVFFTRQLATMVSAGVPLSKALTQLASAEKPVFRVIINAIADDISQGNTFADACARHPGAFDEMYVAVVQSGEVSGALDQVLDELATYMENIEAMRSKVKSAMRYPLFIGGFVFTLVFLIMWKLVPVFQNLYASFNAKLPPLTQFVIDVSQVIQDHVFAAIGLVILTVAGFMTALATSNRFKLFIHTYTLYLPVFGSILRKNILSRFARTMSLLLESGTPILQAVEIAGAAVSNRLYTRALEAVFQQLRTGEQLSTCLQNTGLFPPLVIQLVSTGETAGNIGQLLRKSADFYEREIRNVVDSIAAIIEPFLIILLGIFVGGLLISLYLPVFSIGKYMR